MDAIATMLFFPFLAILWLVSLVVGHLHSGPVEYDPGTFTH